MHSYRPSSFFRSSLLWRYSLPWEIVSQANSFPPRLPTNSTYIRSRSVALQIRLDRLVLLVEVGQIGDEVLDDVGVRQWIQLDVARALGGNSACTMVVSFIMSAQPPAQAETSLGYYECST